jgi:hypothetical protein
MRTALPCGLGDKTSFLSVSAIRGIPSTVMVPTSHEDALLKSSLGCDKLYPSEGRVSTMCQSHVAVMVPISDTVVEGVTEFDARLREADQALLQGILVRQRGSEAGVVQIRAMTILC